MACQLKRERSTESLETTNMAICSKKRVDQAPNRAEGGVDFNTGKLAARIGCDYEGSVAKMQNLCKHRLLDNPTDGNLRSMINVRSAETFDFEQLKRGHALSLPLDFKGATENNLDNDILPCFSDNYWPRRLTNAQLEALRPGMRLASQWLTHISCARFWHAFVGWDWHWDRDMTSDAGDGVRYPELAGWDRDDAEILHDYWLNMIDGMRGSVRFEFFASEPKSSQRFVEAMARVQKRPLRKGARIRRYVVGMHRDFIASADRIARSGRTDTSMVLRFNFLIAKTLCHQFAHLISVITRFWKPRDMNGDTVEPTFLDQHWREAGAAWEHVLFGGVISPISRRFDALDGLCRCTYDNDSLKDDRWEAHYIGLPMEYILKMQRKETYPEPPFTENLEKEAFHFSGTPAAVARTTYHQREVVMQALALPEIPCATGLDADELINQIQAKQGRK